MNKKQVTQDIQEMVDILVQIDKLNLELKNKLESIIKIT